MPSNIISEFPSPQAQIEAEMATIARKKLIQTNRQLRRQGLEPLPLPDVEPSVPACRNSAILALAAFAIFIAGLLALQLLGGGQ